MSWHSEVEPRSIAVCLLRQQRIYIFVKKMVSFKKRKNNFGYFSIPPPAAPNHDFFFAQTD